MRRTNFIKNWLGFFLALIIFVSNLPLNMVLANLQRHVKIKSIESSVDKQDPAYSFNIEWINPAWATDLSPGVTQHPIEPEGFKIYERNATDSNNNYQEVTMPPIAKTATSAKVDRVPLNSGTIYEYKVIPWHNHTVTNPDGTTETKPAPFDPTTPEESALFMTDIQVEAFGSGNSLIVTFDNPKYNGKNIFSGYNIYYQKGGTGVTEFNSKLEVSIDNKDLVKSMDTKRKVERLTYKVTNDNIKPGSIFAVKVEPVLLGKELRKNNTAQLGDENKNKKITFNPKRVKEYRVNDAYVAISLNIIEDGKDYLKLQWGDLSGIVADTGKSIEKIEVYSGENENEINTLIGSIHGSSTDSVNTWRISRPSKKTYYRIKVKVEDIDTLVESIIAVYDPTIVNITPNKPGIYPKNNVIDNKSVIDLYWDTFMRYPYNESEEAAANPDGILFDTNVLYDLWVTDSLEAINKLGLPKILDKISANELTKTNIDDVKTSVFHHVVNEYVTIDNEGNFITKPLGENKTYYIRIVATKPTSDGLGLSSTPADSQIYVPAKGDISNPKSLSKPPLRIKKDEHGNDVISKNEIVVQWNTKWFEVYDKSNDTWYSSAALRNGKLIFGKEIKDTDKLISFYDKKTEEDVRLAFKQAGYSASGSLLVREMDLSQKDINYEMITIPFDEINTGGGYETYIEKLLMSESELWKNIEPKFTDEKYAEYNIPELTENTRYAILLRPYRMLNGGKKDAYPTYILATTLPNDTDIDVTPVIPVLYEVSKTDTSIEVEWKEISKKMLYELAVDENLVEDPSNAKRIIDRETIKNDSTSATKEDENKFEKQFIRYNIKDLFPDTGYYIWIRAIVEDGDKVSDWSNPIYIRTNNIAKPAPPSGFGLASEKSLSTYNTNNNKDYKPITDKYLVLEWLRDIEDTIEESKATASEKTEPLLDPNIKKTYMAKFNELIANRVYYTRAKTKVTITKGSDGIIKKQYSYIAQVSSNYEFKDAIEIEIPTIDAKGDKVLTAESDWTDVYKFRTRYSSDGNGDYDGDINDDLYPLPTEDFEIIYDYVTKTLTYRFRSNKKDQNGNSDNLVDQRFITKLINNKVYNYNIDLTSHKGYDIRNRKVELPYSIISALEERKISLSVTVGGSRFTLNPGFLNTPEVKSLGAINTGALISIGINENLPNLPILGFNQSYGTTPQNINISIDNNGIYKIMTYTGSDMDIYLKLKNRSLTLEKNVGAYRNIDNNLWDRVNANYNSESGMYLVKTNRLGNYTTISNGIKAVNTNDDLTNLINVNTKILFTDLNKVNMKSHLSVVQFNNIVAGISNNKKEMTINGALSTEDYNSLKRSGMILQGSVVGREAGISSLIKLYERKTKQSYIPTNTIYTTPFTDIKNANKSYQINLIKAGELGFFGNSKLSRPKDIMTIEEMLYMVDIILSDSGY